MSMLSLPAPLWYPSRTWAGGAALLARCVVWLLQRHLLLQLHTYVQFLPTALGPPINGEYDANYISIFYITIISNPLVSEPLNFLYNTKFNTF